MMGVMGSSRCLGFLSADGSGGAPAVSGAAMACAAHWSSSPCIGMTVDLREEVPVAGIAHQVGKLV